MGLGGVGGSSAAELVVRLSGSGHFILRFASAVGSSEGVVAHAGNIGTFALSALLDQHQTSLFGSTVRVGRVAGAGNSVLNEIIVRKSNYKHKKQFYLNGAEESAISLADLSGSNVHLKFGSQTLLDVDGPFRIRSISIESGDLKKINYWFIYLDLFRIDYYLSIHERDFERLLQSSQLGLLQELDSREKSLGSIVQANSQVGKLLQKKNIIKNNSVQ